MFLVAVLLTVWPWMVQCNALDQNITSQENVISLLTLLPYFNPVPALNPSWDEGGNIQPVMNLAAEEINSNPRILENYTLELVHGLDGCNINTITSLGFVKTALQPGKIFTGIIGPGCSSSVSFISSLINRPELNLVAVHGGGSPDLANRTLHRNLLGTLGSTDNFVQGYNKLTTKSKWKRMALLYDDARLYYLSTQTAFARRLPSDIRLLYKPVSFTFIPLDVVRDELLRVVFVMCPLELTQRIMCLAKNKSMIYRKYQFLIMTHRLQDIVVPVKFTYDLVKYECSKADMEAALDQAVLLNYNLLETDRTHVSNVSYRDFLDEYERYRELYNEQSGLPRLSDYSIWNSIFYDAVWAWALVLDNLTKSDINFTVNSAYGNVDQSRMIVEQFYRTSFEGVSGEISFTRKTGFTPRRVDIFQVFENKDHLVASISTEGHLNLTGSRSLNFIKDTFHNVTLRENQGLAIFFNLITAIQVVAVAILHILTVVYRNKPSVKASSPKLLHMSYLGLYIMLLGSYSWSLNPAAGIRVEGRNIFCSLLWIWCMPIGFTLTFCPVMMRTWRIYRIFKHYLNPGPFISDPILIGCVVVVLIVDLIVSATWTAVDRFTTTENVFTIISGNDAQETLVGVRLDCVCNYLVIWLGIFYSYKIGILLVVAIFALMTRRITNRSFATSSLRILIYLVTLILPLGFTIFYLISALNLDGPTNLITFTTLCVVLNIMSVLCVVCIFIPPLVPIFRTHYHHQFKHSSSGTQLQVSKI